VLRVWSKIASSYAELSGIHFIAYLLPLADDSLMISKGIVMAMSLLFFLFSYVCLFLLLHNLRKKKDINNNRKTSKPKPSGTNTHTHI